MTIPRVSVILPVYNASDFIVQAVDSILQQTFSDFELLIIDDGSADDSFHKISRFNDSRIRIFRNETNEGLISTLNKGISESEGEFLARMDADDISHPERLFKQVLFLEQNKNIGIVGTAINYFGKEKHKSSQRIKTDSNELKCRFLFASPLNHPTVMFRKELVTEFNLRYDPQFIHAEDYALWWEMIDKTEFANLEEPLLDYRLTADQVSEKNKLQQINSVMEVQKMVFEKLNITINAELLSLQQSIFLENYAAGEEYLQAVEKWFMKLQQANEDTEIFAKDIFRKQLGRQWFLICTTLASKGEKNGSIYKTSLLSEWYQPDMEHLIKFRLKNWLK